MGEPEESNGHPPEPLGGINFPLDRKAHRRVLVERRDEPAPAPPEPSIDDAERIAAVARDLHSAALARGRVRRISVTVDFINGRPRARCVSLIKEITEVPLDSQPKTLNPLGGET